jgi:hypothetical protein
MPTLSLPQSKLKRKILESLNTENQPINSMLQIKTDTVNHQEIIELL